MIDVFAWIVGVSLFLALVGFAGVAWLRRQTFAVASQSAAQIETFNQRLGAIAAFLQELNDVNVEPYARRLDALQEQASVLQERLQNFFHTCQTFEEELNAAPASRLQGILNAPVHWFGRWQRARDLQVETNALAAELTHIEDHAQQIYEIPWELALQCRQAEKDFAELSRIVEELQARRVRGADLQSAVEQLAALRRSLAEVPAEFFRLSKEALLSVVDVDTAIRVYALQQQLRQGIDRWLSKAREWNLAYQKAVTEFADLKHMGSELRQALQHSSEGLEVAPLQSRLDQIAQRAADLGQQLSLPEVAQLSSVAREAAQLRRTVQDAGHQFEKNNQQAVRLRQALNDVHIGLEDLTSQVEELAQRDAYPLVSDVSRARLEQLRQRLQAFGPARQPRAPEQITQHLSELEKITAEYTAELEAFPKRMEQHRALVELLESAEMNEGLAWQRKTRDALQKAAMYHPANWPKQDGLPTLPAELEELRQLQEALTPGNAAQPVLESTLEARLRDTRRLVERYRALRPRVERALNRLDELRKFEKESKDLLSDAFAALDRVGLLAESNDLLAEVAAAEADRQSEEIRLLSNEVNTPGQGEVEKKLQKSRALAEKVNRTLAEWLAYLNAEIAAMGSQIQTRLAQVDAIVLLDDAVAVDARSVLARGEYLAAADEDRAWSAEKAKSTGNGSGALGLFGKPARNVPHAELAAGNLDLTAKIKRRNDLWQTLTAVLQSLEEKTAALITAQEEAAQMREAALESLAELSKHVTKRVWPPNQQKAPDETALLRPNDRSGSPLRKQSMRVEQAVLELGRLTQQYQLAAERIERALERAEQEEDQAAGLEEQIERIVQRWQDQALSDSGNTALNERVRYLTQQARSSRASIQDKYLRGVFSYDEALRSLQLLCSQFDATPVDPGTQEPFDPNGGAAQPKRKTP